MTGLSAMFLSGLSGLRTAQTGLSVVSKNIANANTPGYVRTEITLAPQTLIGSGGGVDVASVRRAADRFLAAASYFAEASRGASTVRAGLLERAQSAFGDPASGSTMFALLDQFWTSVAEISVDPSAALRRMDTISALQSTYSEVQRIGESIQTLITEADQRIADSVERVQSLLDRIADLNREIKITGSTGDATSSENAQAALIDELSTLLDIRVTASPEGGAFIRTAGGALLVGASAATITYAPNGSSFAAHGSITLNAGQATETSLEQYLRDGELKGLLQARDQDLVSLAEALGGFAAGLADTLNAVHNENAAYPAVSSMTGRQTGLLATDAHGFTGEAIIAVTNANGELAERLHIDFDAQTITAEAPAAVYSFAGGTVGAFVTALNTALGAATPAGSASFAGGVLSLDVGNGGGLVVQQDPANPSARAGRGFAHFFGLNDLVTRPTPFFFESGIDGADAHGLNAGGEITYRIRDSAGRPIGERTITIAGALAAPGSDWDDVIAALNAPVTGLGGYGVFALDPATGRVSFTPAAGVDVDLVADTTQRGATGVSFTALHGLSKASTAARAMELRVNADIIADPSRLSIGRPDLTLALGDQIIEGGDNRGASALLAARDIARHFPAAGVLTSQTSTLANYAARLAGEAGRLASSAQREKQGAEAVAAAAGDRRAQVENVSIDDELMKMTTFQNAYAAAARVIQAATDMLDILMSIGYRT